MLEVFNRFINAAEGMEKDEVLEELMALRASFAIQHALKGFDLDYNKALELLRTDEDLSEEQEAQKRVVVAAVDNLIDFAVAEEYQMSQALPEFYDPDELTDEEYEELVDICETYNDKYANVENSDIEFAMSLAAKLIFISDNTILTYETQRDDRVRPWHAQYDGFQAPKGIFPDWLIPPIEHQCRCFLTEDSIMNKIKDVKGAVHSKKDLPEMPEWFNKTFKESVAKGGRIFSDAHPYFDIKKEDKKKLDEIAKRISDTYYKGGDK